MPTSSTKSSSSPKDQVYDVIIIGAGLSGLSASLRLAMFGKKVLLLEKHYVVGGLNSFYSKNGRKFDVGLHALTNYPSINSGKSSPLLKLCRQLRISLDSLDLREQSHSRITFADDHLLFDNNFEFFISQVEEKFPTEKARFHQMLQKMKAFPAYSTDAQELSTRAFLSENLKEPLLREMLLCPTCYYGSARSGDIDLPTFIMLFDAIFRQGLSRPQKGIRSILDQITRKLKKLGVDRKMRSAVRRIHASDDRVSCVELDSGETFEAESVVSTCGALETQEMLDQSMSPKPVEEGRFTIVESMSVYAGSPRDFDWNETVVFFNESSTFDYSEPSELIDLRSGVICMPENYGAEENVELSESKLRITHPANFDKWSLLNEHEYKESKEILENRILSNGLKYLKDGCSLEDTFKSKIVTRDTFTPKTIKRFTSHLNGTLYGSPTKSRDGSTRLKNLFLAGTDQGYVGIVGAMLGGIAVANNQILTR